MKIPAQALENSRRTIQSYESHAREYNAIVTEHPLQPEIADAMRRMMAFVPAGGSVLEIGSGPGRDADFVESLGGVVRRTDAAQAFLDLQAQRGKKGELLDVVADALGGPYDAVLAMCVLIHVDRAQIAAVLRKVFDALVPGGVFLVSMRVGEGEKLGDYHTVCWAKDRFAAELAAAGLPPAGRWSASAATTRRGSTSWRVVRYPEPAALLPHVRHARHEWCRCVVSFLLSRRGWPWQTTGRCRLR